MNSARHPVFGMVCVVGGAALVGSLAGCAAAADQGDAPTEEASTLPLVRDVVNPDLLAELGEAEQSIYLAAPLRPAKVDDQWPQTLFELAPDLTIRDSLETIGIGAIMTFDSADGTTISYLRERCEVLNGAGTECAELGTVDGTDLIPSPGSAELRLDGHELSYEESGGAYWAVRYPVISCAGSEFEVCARIDLDGAEITEFRDCEIVRVEQGEVTWSWSAVEHFPAEQSRSLIDRGDPSEDPFHCNSVEYIAEQGLVMASARNIDSVFAVDISSGEVAWKLGGVHWPGVSLAIANPANAGYGVSSANQAELFGGQHDARYWGDGLISVFDNRSGTGAPARGIAFRIDGDTATVEKVFDDPGKNSSACTGSLRQFESIDYWVAAWGCSFSGITVFDGFGRPVVELSIDFEHAAEREILSSAVPPEVSVALAYRAVIGGRAWAMN